MKTSHLLIAGTLTFNMALSVALLRAHPDFSQAILGDLVQATKMEEEKPKPGLQAPVLTRSAETQAYILDTVRANPGAVRDALLFLESRGEIVPFESAGEVEPEHHEPGEMGAEDIAVADMDMESTENAFVGGNPDGDVTIVQFFDYNCPHCRRAAPVVEDVVAQDGNVRLIYREFPILTPGSAFAARAALAAREQGLYEEYHNALMAAENEIDEDLALQIAQSVGLDILKLTGDMNAPKIVDHLRDSQDLAAAAGIEGTPSFSINGSIAAGAPSAKALQREIDKARTE